MREVTSDYLAQVQASGRQFGVYVKVYGNSAEGDVLWLGDVVSVDILRSCSDQLQIGACMSDRLTLQTRASTLFGGKGRKIEVFYRCTAPILDWVMLGTFYVEESVTKNGITAVTAYDMMARLDKRVVWKDVGAVKAPTFPCKMQAVLKYLCARAGFTTDFVCEDITIDKAPDGYTARELISYIAASHGRNARFSPGEVLKFPAYGEVGKTVQAARCYSLDVEDGSGYTVKGILFQRGGDDKIYIDGTASEYDETADGIVTAFDPFATVGIAEYAWNRLGGLNYSAVSLEMPAENILEPGDVFTVVNVDGTQKKAIVMEQELSLSCTGGFIERISCTAESKAQNRNSENRVEAAEKQAASNSIFPLTEYKYISDDSVKLNGVTYTAEKDAETGLISKISDSNGNSLEPEISAGITNAALHNAVFWAVAMARGISVMADLVLFTGLNGQWQFGGGLTGFTKRGPESQNHSGLDKINCTSGAAAAQLSKSYGPSNSIDGRTNAVVIQSNEKIDLTKYNKLRVQAVLFRNYSSLTGAAYFRTGAPAAVQSGTAYDFSGWVKLGDCDIVSQNYAAPGTPVWYEVDISQLSGEHYLSFGVSHGTESLIYTTYMDIHQIVLSTQ